MDGPVDPFATHQAIAICAACDESIYDTREAATHHWRWYCKDCMRVLYPQRYAELWEDDEVDDTKAIAKCSACDQPNDGTKEGGTVDERWYCRDCMRALYPQRYAELWEDEDD